jgi:hypothetical protein
LCSEKYIGGVREEEGEDREGGQKRKNGRAAKIILARSASRSSREAADVVNIVPYLALLSSAIEGGFAFLFFLSVASAYPARVTFASAM